MTADASQLPVPLGWYLGICGFVFLTCTVVWLCGGAEKADRALADLPTDDEQAVAEPNWMLTADSCACPHCQRLGWAWIAGRSVKRWTDRDDAEFAEYARNGGA